VIYIMGKWDRVAHMNAGRDRAAERRHRGLETGASRWKRHQELAPEKGTWARFEAESKQRWEFAVSDILEQLRFELYGETWEGFEL